MALVPLRLLLDHAAENGYGIPAFNVNNLEQVQSIMEAAYETDSPVILQASRGARSYAGENFLRHLILAAVETYLDIPVVMHQDPRQQPFHLLWRCCQRFHLRDDGRLPGSRRQNPCFLRLQRCCHQRGGGCGPCHRRER